MTQKNIRPINRILLILPPGDESFLQFRTYRDYLDKMGPYPPLGLLSIASYLFQEIKNPDLSVEILDGQFLSQDKIIKKVKDYHPDLIGLSPTSRTYKSALGISRIAKELGSLVILGGYHASGLARQILSNRGPYSEDYCIDGVVFGDGEEAVKDLVEGRTIRCINNFIWQSSSGKIIRNKIQKPNINKFGLIDRNCIDIQTYFQLQQDPQRRNRFKKGLTVISQKGCGWRSRSGGCIFCARMNKEIDIKHPRDLWQEIIHLIESYNIDLVWDTRDDFLENEKWLEGLVDKRLKFGNLEDFRLQSFARIDKVNKKTLNLLEKLALPLIFVVGFESGSNRMLSSMNKGLTRERALSATKALRKLGIWVAGSLVLGAPGEDERTLMETVAFAEELRNMGISIHPHILEPLPNSRAYEMVVAKNKFKYSRQDDIDIHELIKDWVNNFCRVELDKILDVRQELENLNRA